MKLRWAWLGRVGYTATAALQESLRRRILDGDEAAETLLLCEHDPVVTLGRSAQASHVLASDEALKARGIERLVSSRGGDVTYHGPGQLVAYPVMRLQRGVLAHIEAMAQAVIALAAADGIAAEFRRECPGVWVRDRGEAAPSADAAVPRRDGSFQGAKLAAFGVHVHRRVAIHGVALNVSTALDAFELIVPCGLRHTRITSLTQLGGPLRPPGELAAPFARAFAERVGRELEQVDQPIDLTLLS
jgi:lipoyl(octanoyl) transferase